jgi:hypothetical protein
VDARTERHVSDEAGAKGTSGQRIANLLASSPVESVPCMLRSRRRIQLRGDVLYRAARSAVPIGQVSTTFGRTADKSIDDNYTTPRIQG